MGATTTIPKPLIEVLAAARRTVTELGDGATMRAFNAQRPVGVPTAQAMQMRLSALAARTVPWSEVLDVIRRDDRGRLMWLSANSREDAREDLTDEVVVHALRWAAHRLGKRSLGMREYEAACESVMAPSPEWELLDWVVPTVNQVLVHCGRHWENACALAGLESGARTDDGANRGPLTPPPGLPPAQVVALFAALNQRWPSAPVLHVFARASNIRMADASGPMGPRREQATRLLTENGVPVPDSAPKGLGKGKRLIYRYPVKGVPGAPTRSQRDRTVFSEDAFAGMLAAALTGEVAEGELTESPV